MGEIAAAPADICGRRSGEADGTGRAAERGSHNGRKKTGKRTRFAASLLSCADPTARPFADSRIGR